MVVAVAHYATKFLSSSQYTSFIAHLSKKSQCYLCRCRCLPADPDVHCNHVHFGTFIHVGLFLYRCVVNRLNREYFHRIMMHHKMEGKIMSQSQEEMAVIAIFALFWVGKSFRTEPRYVLPTKPNHRIKITRNSLPSGVQVNEGQARWRRYHRQRCCRPRISQGIAGFCEQLARSLLEGRRVLRVRGVHVFLSRRVGHTRAVYLPGVLLPEIMYGRIVSG